MRRERALILMGAYLKLHAYFVSFFQSSPNLTKSIIFHWQCEATIIVKSVGKASSLSTSFLSFCLSWPNVELCAQFFPCYITKLNRGAGGGGGYLAKGKIPSSSHYTCKPFYWTRYFSRASFKAFFWIERSKLSSSRETQAPVVEKVNRISVLLFICY